VQKFMSDVLRALAAGERHKSVLIDRHTVVSYGTRKPDFVAYVANATGDAPSSLDAAHAVFIGDVKLRRAEDSAGTFTAEEKGHLLSLLVDLVQAQLQRVAAIAPHGHTAFVHGFLSDGAHMIFVRVDARYNAERQTAVLSTRSESEPFELAAGLGHLNAWLAAEPASLGFVSPTIELDGSGTSVTLTEALGMGATSMVYYLHASSSSCSSRQCQVRRFAARLRRFVRAPRFPTSSSCTASASAAGRWC
jgi:hypothetical protein